MEVEKWEERADKREMATGDLVLVLGGATIAGRPKARRRGAAVDEAMDARPGVSLCNCLSTSVLRMKAAVQCGQGLVLMR